MTIKQSRHRVRCLRNRFFAPRRRTNSELDITTDARINQPPTSAGSGLEILTGPDGGGRPVIRMRDGVAVETENFPLVHAYGLLRSGRASTFQEALALTPGSHNYPKGLTLVAMASGGPPPPTPPPFRPWDECQAALDDAALGRYQAWRGFSWEFCVDLRDKYRYVGYYRDRAGNFYFCYANYGIGGQVIAEQVFTQSSDPNIPKSFYTAGAAGNISPVILGSLPHAEWIFPTESSHDALAAADKLRNNPKVCFIATRGASNVLSNLPWPKANGGPPPNIIPLCQNDKQVGQDGLTANERWLKRNAPQFPFAYRPWSPPAQFKDFNDWTKAGVTGDELLAALAELIKTTQPVQPAPSLIEFLDPEEVVAYQPPPGTLIVGDNHIVRGNVFVIGGAPGVGKSRATVGLGEAGATQFEWFGLTVHRKFRTVIIQNENGRYRLQQEFAGLDTAQLKPYLRITRPPPYGLCFNKEQFRDQLKRLFDTFPPDVVTIDPWNAVAHDYGQKDYLEAFELVHETIPGGDQAPAMGISAHTRKPRPDERSNKGRALLNLLLGSIVLSTVPRTVWILQHASDDVNENRVIVTCPKNNDGQLGDRTCWERGSGGLWTAVPGFDWNTFDNQGTSSGKGTVITEAAMSTVFDHGNKSMKMREAIAALKKLTGASKSPCYRAMDHVKGPFKYQLFYNPKTDLYTWDPT